MNIVEAILHPIRGKIVALLESRPMTPAMLHEFISQNPGKQASITSIYRHIKVLQDVGFVEAVKRESTDGAPATYYSIVDAKRKVDRDAVTHATLMPLISMLSSIVTGHFSRHAEREETPLPVQRMALFGATVNLSDDEYKLFRDAVYAVMSKTVSAGNSAESPQYIALFTCPDLIAAATATTSESETND
jgi:DNA-binding PadR family transcriptional regulator